MPDDGACVGVREKKGRRRAGPLTVLLEVAVGNEMETPLGREPARVGVGKLGDPRARIPAQRVEQQAVASVEQNLGRLSGR